MVAVCNTDYLLKVKSTSALQSLPKICINRSLGIGVHFEAAMRFWREEFTRIIDDNTFDKKYLYWVKHMYGKVGSMLNYSPYGCMKIISTSVGPGDHHGCPFRHFDVANLKQKMSEYGVNQTGRYLKMFYFYIYKHCTYI